MARFKAAKIAPIILVIIVSIIAIVALVSLARALFFSGSDTQLVDNSRESLLSVDVDRKVSLTVRGPIVADENFHSYSIAVTPNSRVLSTHVGYLGKVVDRVSLDNNTAAYEQFVHALEKEQMWRGTQLTGERDDVRGVCATGKVYEFSIINKDEVVKRLWASTCNSARGSLIGDETKLIRLFQNQIPDAKQVIRKVKL